MTEIKKTTFDEKEKPKLGREKNAKTREKCKEKKPGKHFCVIEIFD